MSTREQWLAERRNYIGASDVGGLLLDKDGQPIHPYKSPHDVWLDKKGLLDGVENERTLMGQLLEPIVAKRFRLANPGITLTPTRTVTGPKPWHRCNPDYFIRQRVEQVPGTALVRPARKASKALLQIKTAGFYTAKEFGVEGTDQIPDWYVAQTQWELHCTGYDLAVLGLLYDTHIYHQFLVYRDQELIDMLVRTVDHFWHNYIVADREPPVTGHKKDTTWLNGAWSAKNEDVVIASPEVEQSVEFLSKHLPRLDKLETLCAQHENTIKAAMKDAAVLETSFGRITWKADKNGRRSFRKSAIKGAA